MISSIRFANHKIVETDVNFCISISTLPVNSPYIKEEKRVSLMLTPYDDKDDQATVWIFMSRKEAGELAKYLQTYAGRKVEGDPT